VGDQPKQTGPPKGGPGKALRAAYLVAGAAGAVGVAASVTSR